MSLWLAKNQQSNEVAALQYALRVKHWERRPLKVDGIFGPHTEEAVRGFQGRHHMTVDGIAGPKTLERLFRRGKLTHTATITSRDGNSPERTGPVSAARPMGSPYDVPFPSRPRPAPPPSSNFFPGLGYLEWLQRQREWDNRKPPKSEPPKLLPNNVPTAPPRYVPPIQPYRFQLPQGPGHLPTRFHLLKNLPRPEIPWLSYQCGTEVEGAMFDAEEVEAKSVASCEVVLVRGDPHFRAALNGRFERPFEDGSEGKFTGGLNVTVTGVDILDHEFLNLTDQRAKVVGGPSLTSAINFGEELRFFAKYGYRLAVEAERNIGRRTLVYGISGFFGLLVEGSRELQGGNGMSFRLGGAALIGVDLKIQRRER